jgi:hypothetical protein
MLALVDGLTMGGLYPDVNMTSIGDPDQPDSLLYESDPSRVRIDIVWNAQGNPDEMSYYRSDDSGSSWDAIGRKVVTWDDEGNVTEVIWSLTYFSANFYRATLKPSGG